MKIALVIGEKLGHPEGLRTFSDEMAVRMGGESIENLIAVDGGFVKWPDALGDFPSKETLDAWAAEYDAAKELEVQKAEAIAAIDKAERDDRLNAAMQDSNAPPAVKKYAESLSKIEG